jgi:CheY-like chemotaxis protein
VSHRLLLADDSLTVHRVIELTFAGEDVAVEAVLNGDQAIARVEAAAPDIVLVDAAMPGTDGYAVARYIKQSPRLSRIPVVLLTGGVDPGERERAAAAGCDRVLTKPVEPNVVIATVRELLSGAPAKPSPVAAPSAAPAPVTPAGDYLDRLDAAFADLSSRPDPPPEARVVSPADSRPKTIPSLADAFAALLDAEQREHGATASVWPAAPTPPLDMDKLVEEVVTRVIARLSDRIVRETVAEIVSAVAERLVREEIERIKSTIT